MTTMTRMVRNITNRYTIEEITEEIDEAGIMTENSKLVQSLTKWLTIDTNKLKEWVQNHPPVQVPSLNISECFTWFLTSRGLWITVHHCAKRKRTSIICESSQFTMEYHELDSQDSNNVETKMNLQACIGKPLPPRCGKIPAFSKSSSGSSGGSSNPMSIHPRTKSNFCEEKDFSKRQNLDYNSWMTDVENTFFWNAHLPVCLLRHHDESGKRRKWEKF